MAISNAEGESASTKEGERKRKRRAAAAPAAAAAAAPSKWRSQTEQETYSSKIQEALRRVHASGAAAASKQHRSRAVREAVDRALAVAARGQTQWSCAILSRRSLPLKAKRRSLPLKAKRRRPYAVAPPTPPTPPPPPPRSGGGGGGAAAKRSARVLARLVPGCKKLKIPELLDETCDYIPALEMQVRAMTALYEILSAVRGGGGASSSAAPPPPPPPSHPHPGPV